jgi:hypothetical protein
VSIERETERREKEGDVERERERKRAHLLISNVDANFREVTG